MTTSHAEGWTEPRTETLKRLWLDGLSASQVATILGGGATRNAVLGKLHRLGIMRRDTPSKPQCNPRRERLTDARAPRVTRPVATRPAASPKAHRPRVEGAITRARTERAYVEKHVPSVGLTGLSSHTCKWPIGDPRAEGFGFCGCRVETAPYCSDHALAAYRPGGKISPASLLKLAGL